MPLASRPPARAKLNSTNIGSSMRRLGSSVGSLNSRQRSLESSMGLLLLCLMVWGDRGCGSLHFDPLEACARPLAALPLCALEASWLECRAPTALNSLSALPISCIFDDVGPLVFCSRRPEGGPPGRVAWPEWPPGRVTAGHGCNEVRPRDPG